MRRPGLRADAALVAIAAAGLAVRVAYTVRLGQHVDLGISDADFYSGGANALADGQGYIDVFRALQTGRALPTAHHPPGWPAVLAVFSALGVESELGHRLVGCLVGAVAVFVVGRLGRRIGGRAVGLISAGLAALHPTLVAADGSLMAETLSGLLVLLVLLAALRTVDRSSAARALLVGLTIGAAALVRGEALLYLPLVVVPLAVCVARRSGRSVRALARVGGVATVGVVALVLPWTARNLVQLDGFVLISTNESTVLAGANCDRTYYGSDVGGWQFDCVARHPDPISEVEQAALWRRQGSTYLRQHTTRLPFVLTQRVLRTWGLRADPGPAPEGRDAGVQRVGSIVWVAALLPLGTAGAVLVARRRSRIELALLLAPVGAATFISVAGFGMLRFRHTMELVALVLTAVTVDALLGRLAGRAR